jgi:hypothetical protein
MSSKRLVNALVELTHTRQALCVAVAGGGSISREEHFLTEEAGEVYSKINNGSLLNVVIL